jgi:hypothetical protein
MAMRWCMRREIRNYDHDFELAFLIHSLALFREAFVKSMMMEKLILQTVLSIISVRERRKE